MRMLMMCVSHLMCVSVSRPWQLFCVWTEEPGVAAGFNGNPMGAAVGSFFLVLEWA